MGATLPAPGVLSVTGKWAELVVGERIVQVTVVGVVEHGFDALSEKCSVKTPQSDCFMVCCLHLEHLNNS